MKYISAIIMMLGLLFPSCNEDEVMSFDQKDVSPAGLVASGSPLAEAMVRDYSQTYQNQLQRSYGVGYGYNAFGKYADYESIRDIIINVDSLLYYEAVEHCSILADDRTPEAYQHVMTGEDSEKLLKALTANASLNADLAFFQAEVKGSYASSDLRCNYYSFCTINTGITLASRHLDPLSLAVLCRKHPTILTPGFRQLLDEVEECMEGTTPNLHLATQFMDLLYDIYGTHLIYHADLGGRLTFLSTFERASLDSKTGLSTAAKANLLKLCNFSSTEGEESAYNQTSSKCKKRITACGGDATLISKMLFSGTDQDKTESMDAGIVTDWFKSVVIDFENDENSNVELIDTKLYPLSDFLIGLGRDRVSQLVAQKVEQQFAHEDALFPRVYTSLNVKLPINVVRLASTSQIHTLHSNNETIGEIDYECIHGKEYVVLYPTIDGTLCHEGIGRAYGADSLYIITWQDTVPYITPIGVVHDFPNLYYTHGALDVAPTNGISYDTNYTNDVLTAYMWTSEAKASLKVGPYTLIQGAYASMQQTTWSSYNTVIQDIPIGCKDAKLSDMNALITLMKRHYRGCPEMLKNKNWLIREAAGSNPEAYVVSEDLELNKAQNATFGFVPCQRDAEFRYP